MSILAAFDPLQVRSTVCLPCTLRPEAVSVIWPGVGVGVGVTVGVGVGVGVTVGVGVGVTVGVGVGVGVASDCSGAWISTEIDEPVLKNPTFAVLMAGGAVESKRKLYNVPQRIALAFGFCASVSQFQVAEVKLSVKVQGALRYPWLLNVPSLAHPGS